MRMKPASTTRSGENPSMTRASSASKSSRLAKALWSTTAVVMPCDAANARPPASGRLLMTAATSAGQPSAWQAFTMASMLEPRPEIRITTRFMGRQCRRPSPDRRHPAAVDRQSAPHVDPCPPPPARALRHAPDRRPAPRPLPRRAQELGAAAGHARRLLLRRRLACADHHPPRPRHPQPPCLRHGDRLARRRPGPGALHPVPAEPHAGACRALHAAGHVHSVELAGPHAELQGPGRRRPRARHLWLPRLPAAASRGHPALQARRRAGRGRPGRPCRSHARGRAPLQPRLCGPGAGLRRAPGPADRNRPRSRPGRPEDEQEPGQRDRDARRARGHGRQAPHHAHRPATGAAQRRR
mmetsp:Transcript_42317/g.99294  ORF Transcript_42317/g.99294 Transcript_42317/m.99294 type:complete len:355 (+) Transcript_42317:3627-4691(+)